MALTNERGFSLLEVLLVAVIIVILAAIAIPRYAETRSRGVDSKVLSAVRNVAVAEEAYYATHQRYADDIHDLEGVVLGDVDVSIEHGNTGSFGSSFAVFGSAKGAANGYLWVSDPEPGQLRLASAPLRD